MPLLTASPNARQAALPIFLVSFASHLVFRLRGDSTRLAFGLLLLMTNYLALVFMFLIRTDGSWLASPGWGRLIRANRILVRSSRGGLPPL